MRYGPGWKLPNDQAGRNHLKTLLATATFVGPRLHWWTERWAAQIPPPEMRVLVDEVYAKPMSFWTDKVLGELLDLTLDEWETHDLRNLWPAGVPEDVVEERRWERKKRKQRKWVREKRQADTAGLGPKAKSLYEAIPYASTRLSAIADRLWWKNRTKPDWKAKQRRAARYEASKLIKRGLIKSKIKRGRTGLSTMYVWRSQRDKKVSTHRMKISGASTDFCPAQRDNRKGPYGMGTSNAKRACRRTRSFTST